MIVDTHAHLNDKRYFEDLDEVLTNSQQNEIIATIIPGADPRELQRAVDLSKDHKELYFSVGVHPYDIDYYDREYLKKIYK